MKLDRSKLTFKSFSKKQLQLLTWYQSSSPHCTRDGIIADGAIRSGKSYIMSFSFVVWAMSNFKYMSFGMAGKTIQSFIRNVWIELKKLLIRRGFVITKNTESGDNTWDIHYKDYHNTFYIFGGKDERSQDIVQGFTAAGFFFDEATLQPETFINQAVSRCSVENAKWWFNCNPKGPFHWLKKEWIDKAEEKNLYRIQFELDDNPSLSTAVKDRYKRQFSGIFFKRYILGLWVASEGLIYSMFEEGRHILKKVPDEVKIIQKFIAVDYGSTNPTVFLLIGLGSDNKYYILKEYYHKADEFNAAKSPKTYAKDFKNFMQSSGLISYIYIDPSAKGFILQLYEEGIKKIIAADNEVLLGIETVASMLDSGLLFVLDKCKKTILEFAAYSWSVNYEKRGLDSPQKENDHAMDAIRYFVNMNKNKIQKLLAA